MPNKPKRQAAKKPSYITLDLSPQEKNHLMAIAIRKLLVEALLEAHNEVK